MTENPHLLYIEANKFNQRLIKKILGPAGFTISEAFDGIQGIKKAAELGPDLILIDLDLPYLDGLGATAKIKSIHGLEDVPVIALTAKTSERDRERAFVAGCDGYISKPIDAKTFPQKIRTYLEGEREVLDPANKTQILRDFNVTLVDQLQTKVEELERANLELVKNKEALLVAYGQSQESKAELEGLTKLKENIVNITSHELRTPLSIATGYIDLLLEGMIGKVDDDQCRVLRIAQQSLKKMSELIDKITDLNRLALHKFPLHLTEIDLNQAFLNVYNDHVIFMKIRRLELVVDLSADPIWVLVDESLITQVFSNLLKNAICFTPDGGKIMVSTRVVGDKAFFQVEDSGIGISEENLERIFEEFYQVQDAEHHQTGHFEFMTRGIGVGLALCKGILNELGGKIWAESSELYQGSSFTFYLPVVKKE